jgi:ribosomal protein S18 acetylase RimI-like enzyme
MSVALRPAKLLDASAVADVYLASRKAFLTFAPLVHSEEETRQWISDVVIPAGRVTVAVAGGSISGMMALSRREGIGWVDHLYVHPAAAGQGIGTRLLEQALQELQPPVRLYVFQANVRARRFYERHGFTAIDFSDGGANEERCPDVLYEWRTGQS